MTNIKITNLEKAVSPIVVGCMRFAELSNDEMNKLIHSALDKGVCFFDHADIYGGGKSEEVFGNAWSSDTGISRDSMIIQSKCGINNFGKYAYYDSSKEYILNAVDGSLKRLKTDYLDFLLIHRPDALVCPEEVAEAFDILHQAGKVRQFGVSNHNPMQIELLKKYVKQPLVVNQLQFSIPVSNMVASGMEVNMTSEGAYDRDGSVLDYSRLNDMTIQAWSPFQKPNWGGCFIDAPDYKDLNDILAELSSKYGVSKTTIASAWILRHPAKMQLIAGTTKLERLDEIIEAANVELTKEEWYRLYLAAGHILP